MVTDEPTYEFEENTESTAAEAEQLNRCFTAKSVHYKRNESFTTESGLTIEIYVILPYNLLLPSFTRTL